MLKLTSLTLTAALLTSCATYKKMRAKKPLQPTKEEATATKKQITEQYPTLSGATPPRVDPAAAPAPIPDQSTNDTSALPVANQTPKPLPPTTELLEPSVTKLPTNKDLEDSAIPSLTSSPTVIVPNVTLPSQSTPSTSTPKVSTP